MECRSCTDALTALMDGELSSDEKGVVEGHLASCPGCREEYDSLSYAYALMERLPSLSPAPRLWHRIEAEISTKPEGESFWESFRRAVFRPWVPATAGLAVLVISLLMINPAPDPLERDFVNFIQQRQQQFEENSTLLFSNDLNNRYHPRRNPFSPDVTQVQHNPFQE